MWVFTEYKTPKILDATVFSHKRACPTFTLLKSVNCHFEKQMYLVPVTPGPMELLCGNVSFPLSFFSRLYSFDFTKKRPFTTLNDMNYSTKTPPQGEETSHGNMGLISDGDPNELRDDPSE